jgi:serine-type D-Ala-D-Ala carboxypeptidase/endopeptidase (penicillin-binding protein 4)
MALRILLFTLVHSWLTAQLNTPEEWRSDPLLRHASISYCVRDASTGKILAEQNSQVSLVPASTLKVMTTSAALAILGKNFRFETRLVHTGTFDKEKGIIDGDLFIMGGGDPTLHSENFSRNTDPDTYKWAKILFEKGIREIHGDVIGDASAFPRRIPDNWIWGDISNYYGTAPCALSMRDNKFSVIFSISNKTRADISYIEPDYKERKIRISSEVRPGGTTDEAYLYGDPFSFSREIRGTIPAGKSQYTVEGSLPDPALLCAEYMIESLERAGIKCTGKALSVYNKTDEATKKQLLHLHFSPTLDRIIYYTNLKSVNLYAESMVLALGKGSSQQGLIRIKRYWKDRGLDSLGINLSDGSGLSRSNSMTTAFQTQLLSKIYNDTLLYKTINGSLPVAGVHGSMTSIGKGTLLENNMRAKTGYITRARAYCGYVKTRGGKDLSFSVIFNNYDCTAKEAREKITTLMKEIAELNIEAEK